MLPPVDAAVLQRNPGFENLYKDLCTRKLNADGSTRDSRKERVNIEIQKSLESARLQLLSSQVLVSTLSGILSTASELPIELQACIETVVAQLNGHVPENDRKILSGDVNHFTENIHMISEALSAQFSLVADSLCKIADPITDIPVQNLNSQANLLQENATHALPRELAEARMNLTQAIASLLHTHEKLLESCIRILEHTKHGALARHTKSSAELLNARATVLGLQAKIHTFSHAPPMEFTAALKGFMKEQRSDDRALKDRAALASRELELYNNAGEKALKDLAKRKKYLVSEIDRIEQEISDLSKSSTRL